MGGLAHSSSFLFSPHREPSGVDGVDGVNGAGMGSSLEADPSPSGR